MKRFRQASEEQARVQSAMRQSNPKRFKGHSSRRSRDYMGYSLDDEAVAAATVTQPGPSAAANTSSFAAAAGPSHSPAPPKKPRGPYGIEATAAAAARRQQLDPSIGSAAVGWRDEVNQGRSHVHPASSFNKGSGKSKDTAILISSSDSEENALSGDSRQHSGPVIVKPVPRYPNVKVERRGHEPSPSHRPNAEPLFLPRPPSSSVDSSPQDRSSPPRRHATPAHIPSPPPLAFPAASQRRKYGRRRSPTPASDGDQADAALEFGELGADFWNEFDELFGEDVSPTPPEKSNSERAREDSTNTKRESMDEAASARLHPNGILASPSFGTQPIASSSSASALFTSPYGAPSSTASATPTLPTITSPAEAPELANPSQATTSSISASTVPSPTSDPEGYLAHVLMAITTDFPDLARSMLMSLVPMVVGSPHGLTHSRLSELFQELFDPPRPFVLHDDAAHVLLETVADRQYYLPPHSLFKTEPMKRIAAYLVRRRIHSADTVELQSMSPGIKPRRFATAVDAITTSTLYIDEERPNWPWKPIDPGDKRSCHCLFPSATVVVVRQLAMDHLFDYPEDLAGLASVVRPKEVCFDFNLAAKYEEPEGAIEHAIAAIVRYAEPELKYINFHSADTIIPNAGLGLHYWLYCSPSSLSYTPKVLATGPDGRKVNPPDAWVKRWTRAALADLGRFGRDKDDHKKTRRSTYEVVYRKPTGSTEDVLAALPWKVKRYMTAGIRKRYPQTRGPGAGDGDLDAGRNAILATDTSKILSVKSYGRFTSIECPGCSQMLNRGEKKDKKVKA
ncbi:hypothetical protein Q8F55_006223 [Vanrija albida]|uniref:Uncharacterized protein n=1 Tax=Vanrija albida TaxID=181172 RepID=A0ABR3PWG9_9TREE